MKIVEPSPPSGSEFFSSIWQGQTWLNILYLFFSFPLGILYFVFLVTGISLGFGLLVTVFGIFILMGVVLMVHYFARFEIGITNVLLGFQIRVNTERLKEPGFWKRFRGLLVHSLTWKGLLFLFIKFPLGIFNFSLAISLLAASLALIASPILYFYPGYDFTFSEFRWWYIDTIPETLILAVIGLALFLISIYVLNLLAWANGILAKALLED